MWPPGCGHRPSRRRWAVTRVSHLPSSPDRPLRAEVCCRSIRRPRPVDCAGVVTPWRKQPWLSSRLRQVDGADRPGDARRAGGTGARLRVAHRSLRSGQAERRACECRAASRVRCAGCAPRRLRRARSRIRSILIGCDLVESKSPVLTPRQLGRSRQRGAGCGRRAATRAPFAAGALEAALSLLSAGEPGRCRAFSLESAVVFDLVPEARWRTVAGADAFDDLDTPDDLARLGLRAPD